MKIALMQPYFFPYLGYYQLVKSVDEFVIFDQAQYLKRSWMNRNRILNNQKEFTFITIPVCKAPRDTKINKIQIDYKSNWKKRIYNQLQYYKKAPNYQMVLELLEELFDERVENLSMLNTLILKKTCSLFGIETKITILSEVMPELISTDAADEWGVLISKYRRATTYINAIGGKEFYNQQKYSDHGIYLKFLHSTLRPYKQFNKEFIPGLSIIDLMMFNSLHDIKKMLNDYKLIN